VTQVDPRESISADETAQVLDPREVVGVKWSDPREVVGEGSPAPADEPAELAEVISILSEEQQRRTAALREARALLEAKGYPGLRAQAGELTALASWILDGKATWTDEDEDADPE
jgi:hypothetical protein